MKNKKIIYLLIFGMILIVSEQNNIYTNNIDFSRNVFTIFKVVENENKNKIEIKSTNNKFYLDFFKNEYLPYIYMKYINPSIINILNNNILKFLE